MVLFQGLAEKGGRVVPAVTRRGEMAELVVQEAQPIMTSTREPMLHPAGKGGRAVLAAPAPAGQGELEEGEVMEYRPEWAVQAGLSAQALQVVAVQADKAAQVDPTELRDLPELREQGSLELWEDPAPMDLHVPGADASHCEKQFLGGCGEELLVAFR